MALKEGWRKRLPEEVWVYVPEVQWDDEIPKAVGVHNDFFKGGARYVLGSHREEELKDAHALNRKLQSEVDALKAKLEK